MPTVIYVNLEYSDLVAHLRDRGSPLSVEGIPIRQGMRNGVVDDDGRFVNF